MNYTQEGTVKVVTYFGRIERVYTAKIAAQTKQIEAATFANPALLEIKKLELQLEIERAPRASAPTRGR
ncbi:MAG TPA: hypothetical protein VF621_12570 [Pyrinomonadaceae bacterium]|jgi:uncharacterized protein YktA (UPF0223 family)